MRARTANTTWLRRVTAALQIFGQAICLSCMPLTHFESDDANCDSVFVATTGTHEIITWCSGHSMADDYTSCSIAAVPFCFFFATPNFALFVCPITFTFCFIIFSCLVPGIENGPIEKVDCAIVGSGIR